MGARLAGSEPRAAALTNREDAEAHVASICFKTGPPRLLGVELEWTVHHAADPARPLDGVLLADALHPHTPRTLCPDSPAAALPSGAPLSLEPGGQVEISSRPHLSLSGLLTATAADIDHLSALLGAAGLVLGEHAVDPFRPPRRILDTARYAAMERALDRGGADGRIMMCGTAGLQVCVDAGAPDRVARRWDTLHALGPVLLAMFANSPRHLGRVTGWASTRMRTWFRTDPLRTGAPERCGDPVGAWAARVLDTPVLCVRRPGAAWDVPAGLTFADWIRGGLPAPPTVEDLDLHLSTLFPPVRPRGYFEVRYLDAQPGTGWIAPLCVLAALMADESTVDEAYRLAGPGAGRWTAAARYGLADPVLADVAPPVVDLALTALDRTDVSADVRAAVAATVERRLARGGVPVR